jgi:putative resolvase
MNNAQQQYVGSKHIREQYDVSNATLRRWEQEGKVSAIRTPGGKRLYNNAELQTLLSIPEPERKEKVKIAYARVSSDKQRGDLERQIESLKRDYPDYEVVSDIGSGINFQRKQFTRLLERVLRGEVSHVAISRRDRLCRFAFNLVKKIFKESGCTIVVQSNAPETEDEAKELSEDLLAIVTVFMAKNNGRRAAEDRRKRKQQASTEEETENPKSRKRKRKEKEAREESSGESDQD